MLMEQSESREEELERGRVMKVLGYLGKVLTPSERSCCSLRGCILKQPHEESEFLFTASESA